MIQRAYLLYRGFWESFFRSGNALNLEIASVTIPQASALIAIKI